MTVQAQACRFSEAAKDARCSVFDSVSGGMMAP